MAERSPPYYTYYVCCTQRTKQHNTSSTIESEANATNERKNDVVLLSLERSQRGETNEVLRHGVSFTECVSLTEVKKVWGIK